MSKIVKNNNNYWIFINDSKDKSRSSSQIDHLRVIPTNPEDADVAKLAEKMIKYHLKGLAGKNVKP